MTDAYHITAELISHESSGPLHWLHLCNVCVYSTECLHVLTTSRMSMLTSKLGFFFILRMTQLWIISPPHSTCRLGEVTVANWKLFRLRTPHAKICRRGEKDKQRYYRFFFSLIFKCHEIKGRSVKFHFHLDNASPSQKRKRSLKPPVANQWHFFALYLLLMHLCCPLLDT